MSRTGVGFVGLLKSALRDKDVSDDILCLLACKMGISGSSYGARLIGEVYRDRK